MLHKVIADPGEVGFGQDRDEVEILGDARSEGNGKLRAFMESPRTLSQP